MTIVSAKKNKIYLLMKKINSVFFRSMVLLLQVYILMNSSFVKAHHKTQSLVITVRKVGKVNNCKCILVTITSYSTALQKILEATALNFIEEQCLK